jgi:hypothetical protein
VSRRRRARPDQYELAAERLRAEIEPYEPLPQGLHRFTPRRLVLYVLLGVVVVALVHSGTKGRKELPVTGSCTQPGFTIDHDTVPVNGKLSWAVVGPTGAEALVTVDSSSPDRGVAAGPTTLRACRAGGQFTLEAPAGAHVLRVFLINPEGTSQLVGSKELVVNAPR